MPGVLVGEKLDPASSVSSPYSVSMPHPSLSHLSPLQHYIPVLTRSIAPEFCGDEPSSHLSPPPRRAGLLLDVNDLPEMYLEDGNLHEPGLPLQLSPVSATQWGCNSASPTTLSALSALRRFLPSNFEEDKSVNVLQMDLYAGDEFRMYEFKVKRCMRGRSHDWTECPFVHLGEKARRRDLRRFHYSGTPCADFRKGSCKKGNQCEFAHGVFECWLHPTRYRTQPCKDGRGCRRRVCFFAHTPDQLRVSSPIASPSVLSLPRSRHFPSMEAFDLWGPSSPTSLCSPVKLSEPFPPSFSSSPFCRTGMEALDDATAPSNFSLLAPSSVSLPMSSSPSSPDASINWSPRGVSAYTLPIPHSSLHQNHSQVSLLPGSVPHCRHSESMNLSIPTAQIQSKSASSLPTLSSCTAVAVSSTMQQIDDLMSLLKQANLEQQEPAWLQVRGAPPPPQLLNFLVAPLQGRTGSVPVKPTKVGFRASDEELLNGGFFNDDKGGESCEAKLERVESGKGLRAQIFESLLRSASTDQESNSNSQPSMC